MSDADDEIRATIAAFTAEIVALVHEVARAELASAVSSAPNRANPKPARRAMDATTASSSSSSPAAEPVPAATLERIAGFVRVHAAYTASEIAAGLGAPSDDVAAALAELVRARRVRKSGARAQTRYFAI